MTSSGSFSHRLHESLCAYVICNLIYRNRKSDSGCWERRKKGTTWARLSSEALITNAQFPDSLHNFTKISLNFLLCSTLNAFVKKFVDHRRLARVSTRLHACCWHELVLERLWRGLLGLARYITRDNKLDFFLSLFIHSHPICPLGSVFQSFASTPSLTPDDDVFRHLSLVYASNHAKMSRGVACKSSASTPSFQNGITNGAAWYPLTGGMQDYNYVWFGCYEVTLEISCCKFPPAHELKKYWTDNQLSMVKFLAEAHRGVQGFVSDQSGAPIEKASMKIKGRDVGFLTTKYGEFWRILLPGVYKLEVRSRHLKRLTSDFSLNTIVLTYALTVIRRSTPKDFLLARSSSWWWVLTPPIVGLFIQIYSDKTTKKKLS